MGVQLKGAFLLVARLAQANLRNARLKGGADLSGTTGLSEEQLRDAHGDAATKLPEGITRPVHWPSAARVAPACPPISADQPESGEAALFPSRSAQILHRQLSRIRLLPWVADGEALACLVARLAQANLRNARLKGGADLSGTTGLSEEQLRDAHEEEAPLSCTPIDWPARDAQR